MIFHRPISAPQSSFRLLLARAFPKSPIVGAAALLCTASATFAGQPGTIDTSFINPHNNIVGTSFLVPPRAAFTAFALGLQPQPTGDPKIIVGGDNGALFRLNADGTIDNTFNGSPAVPLGVGQIGGRIVFSLSVQSDNKIVIAGRFGYHNPGINSPFINIIRLNPDGSTESNGAGGLSTFNANLGTGAGAEIFTLVTRTAASPGSFLISGRFLSFNGVTATRFAQIKPDGTLDLTFNHNIDQGPDGRAFGVAEAPSGQIYVGGIFKKFNNANGPLVRLNADGTHDPSFQPKFGESSSIFALAVQSDGKLIVAGEFSSVNGGSRKNIVRLNPDGTTDNTFNASVTMSQPKDVPPTAVYTMLIQPNGQILLGGNFLEIDGQPRKYIGRINADGTLDTVFNSDSELSGAVQSIVLQSVAATGTLDPVVGQNQAPRKVVRGAAGYYPFPVVRLFNN